MSEASGQERLPLDQYLLDALERAPGRRTGGSLPPAAAGWAPDRNGRTGAVRGPGHAAGTWTWRPAGCGAGARATTPSARPATRATPRSRPRCARPIRRCCTTAPAPSTSRAGRAGAGPRPAAGRAARRGRGHRRADRRRPAQGLRPPRPGGDPADLDDRLAPAAGGRAWRSPSTGRARLGVPSAWPADAIVVCSFGDASANHSTATGAINTAVPHRTPAPSRCRCCSSARTTASASACATPAGLDRARPTGTGRHLRYFEADGTDPWRLSTWRRDAADLRPERAAPGVPAPAHRAADGPRRVRRGGGVPHAGRDRRRLDARPAARHGAGCWSRAGVADPGRGDRPLRARCAPRCMALAEEVATTPQLTAAEAVMAPLRPAPRRSSTRQPVAAVPWRRRADVRRALPEDEGPLTLAQAINRDAGRPARALPGGAGLRRGRGRKGGVYGVTRGLPSRSGAARVFDTLLDEQSILGLALGAGADRAAAGAGDPVPGLPAQRRGPAAGRGRHAAVLLPGRSTATRWWCGSPGTATRRASAGTSTTTTRSACSATSRGS